MSRLCDQRGQGLTEYALILVLVAVVVIVILAILGPAVGNVFSNIMVAIDPLAVKPKMHVHAIHNVSCTMSSCQAQVTIVYSGGSPISGATVNGRFQRTGGQQNAQNVTGGSGVANIAATVGGSGSPTFCVTGVSHAEYAYDSASNVETCD